MLNTFEVKFQYTQYSVTEQLLIRSREGTNDVILVKPVAISHFKM